MSEKYFKVKNGIITGGNISVTGTVDGRYVSIDGSKLDGIEAGATADQTAAQILAAVKTVDGAGSGLDADLLDGQSSDYYATATSVAAIAALDPVLTLAGDATGTATFTNLGNATLTVAIVDDSHNHIISNVDGLQTALDSKLATTLKGAVNGVAELDATGKVPTAQLPSYVDDVLEYVNLAGFPVTGETGKIYLALDTNKTYRWSGSAYVYITSGAVDSVAGRTGVVTLAKADVGLSSVDNTADSAKAVLSATKLTTARTLTLGSSGKTFDGLANVTWTTDEIGVEAKQAINSIRNNLGDPTVREAALIHGQMNNKFRFIPATTQEESTDGTTWTTSTRATQNQLADLMLGEGQNTSFAAIPSSTVGTYGAYRLTWDVVSQVGYVFLNYLYFYNSTNGNTVTTTLEAFHNTNGWVTIAGPQNFSNWPGHTTVPHTTIPYSASAAQYGKVRVTFSTTHAANINAFHLYGLEWFGAYPAGRRNVESYDRLKNASFPNGVYANNVLLTGSTGTVTSVTAAGTVSGLTITGGTITTTGTITLGGTLSASIDNITDEYRLFNNMGDIHSTRASFDATTPSYNFGWRFVQGSTNGPSTGGTQFYSVYVGLGNDYPATGAGSYGMFMAVDRNSTTPYLSIRYNENNSLSTWRKIYAGAADVLTTARTIGGVSFNGSANINLPGVNTTGNQNTTGNAATATTTPSVSVDNSITYGRSGLQFVQASGLAGDVATTTNTPTADWWHIIRGNHGNVAGYYTDLALPMTAATNIRYRRISAGVSSGWLTVLDNTNYNSYSPTLTGTGASGSWGISVTGNAATTTKLQTARTINGVSFDGTANITVPGSGATISTSAPTGVSAGALWWDSEAGKLFIYYTDSTSSQWVESSAPSSPFPASLDLGAL